MEVMQNRKTEEEEVTETEEAQLILERRRTRNSDGAADAGDITSSSSSERGASDVTDMASEVAEKIIGKTENTVYFDNNEGMWKCPHCIWTYKNGSPLVDHVHRKSSSHRSRGSTIHWSDSSKNLQPDDSVMNSQHEGNSQGEIVSGFSVSALEQTSTEANESARTDLEEESDEEVIELEFERAVEKVHTHTPYCPKCNSQITKVVLRRKIRGTRLRPHVDNQTHDKPVDLFGCLSCFSIFIPSGNCLNSFSLFGNKGKNDGKLPTVEETHALGASVPAPSGPSNANGDKIKQGSVFDLFWNFGKGKGDESAENPQGNDHVKNEEKNKNEARLPLLQGKFPGSASNVTDESKKPVYIPAVSEIFESLPVSAVVLDIDEGIDGINKVPAAPPESEIKEQPNAKFSQPTGGRETITRNGSTLWEILKCIVYGGLIELITSFGVVTSADSSGASKLNIIALGIANVISGLFVLGHNLIDLKKEDSKYQELLGRREHFVLHATFAILSYLLFGFMPPVTYGFTKFWIVVAASFACILVLAIAKAYVDRTPTFFGYVKTVSYYVTTAVTASGLAYVVGDQIKKLVEEIGLFDPSAAFPPPFAPDMNSTTQGWSSL